MEQHQVGPGAAADRPGAVHTHAGATDGKGRMTSPSVDGTEVDPAQARPAEKGSRKWRVALAVAGLGVLAAAVYGAGIGEIGRHLAALGWAVPLLLIPYASNQVINSAAFAVALPRGPGATRVSFLHVNLIRLAGESINDVTPTADFGGEPVKVHLLTRYGISGTDAVAGVMVTKTALIASQIIFVVMGVVMLVLTRGDVTHPIEIAACLTATGLVIIFAMVEVQRRRLVTATARLATRLFPRSAWVARLSENAATIDSRLASFYGKDRRVFLISTALSFAAWLIGMAEVYFVFFSINVPVSLQDAFVIESLAGTMRFLTIIVPGTIGVQEVGGTIICQLVGVAAAPALTLMLFKRARDTLLTVSGLLALAWIRGKNPGE